MRKPERSTYTSLDFQQWQEAGTLVISPKFQRRGVWSRAAQSFLIDTLLLGLPVPPIYLRVVQDINKKAMIREVVDGQQRVNAVLSYMNDKYRLSRNIESSCVGKRYSELDEGQQNAIAQYSFICEVLYGVEDRDILQIFARLNTNAVRANAQELRNGKYFGEFKQSCYNLAVEHLEFWRQKRLFTEQGIARMREVELTSELMIAMLAGLQDKKKSIDSFYASKDDEFLERHSTENRFRSVIDAINEAVGEDLGKTEFRRVPLFYSLFGALHHRMYGMPSVRLPTPATGRLPQADAEGVQEAVTTLSNALEAAIDQEDGTPEAYQEFVAACLRQTDNLRPRQARLEAIYRKAFS
jgi:uncharacterized protein with ParB-like and HNH nuclease domain